MTMNNTLVNEYTKNCEGLRGSSILSKMQITGCCVLGWKNSFFLTCAGILPFLAAMETSWGSWQIHYDIRLVKSKSSSNFLCPVNEITKPFFLMHAQSL